MFSSIVNAVLVVLGSGFITMLGWVFSIANRVTALETGVKEPEKALNSVKELINTQFAEVRRRLTVLELKIDRRHDDTEE